MFYRKIQKATLVFIVDEKRRTILLALKKRGFGMGLWNGTGGKVEETDSSPMWAAIRETKEELGIAIEKPSRKALLHFYFPHSKKRITVFVYVAHSWRGEPTESEEMKPQWFDLKSIPYDKMWKDDALWLPEVLALKYVKGTFILSEEGEIIDYTMRTY